MFGSRRPSALVPIGPTRYQPRYAPGSFILRSPRMRPGRVAADTAGGPARVSTTTWTARRPFRAPSGRRPAGRCRPGGGPRYVAGVRSALGDGGPQNRLQRAVEAIDLCSGEAVDPRQG